ncbi:TetR/AcrR family transcriptional regulator [Blastococcus saxobsidens]|uniref:TetR family transcriptional regulator n=1 Tax=Blastococcus saxobsidens TaxID=138336 RepID=A0A4V2G2T1_9ACTN|nr:TetR/AcrR family transcriptional regulator [Blastococcus saxobsidens]RZU34356.1 TetR family transcriptional regulator [Blastococcus saxobsidens]
MATPASPPSSRVESRRAAMRAEALDHAIALMTEEGAGALSLSEVARRLGIRGPSLYKYFPSRNALYDALFARGLAEEQAAVQAALVGVPRGTQRIRAGGEAVVRWAVEHPALAQLLHWRPVPGFQPSPQTFEPSREDMATVQEEFAEAVRLGQLSPAANGEDAVRLYTVVLSGLISQQLANQPGVTYGEGTFSRLTGTAIDLFLSAYDPPGTTM